MTLNRNTTYLSFNTNLLLFLYVTEIFHWKYYSEHLYIFSSFTFNYIQTNITVIKVQLVIGIYTLPQVCHLCIQVTVLQNIKL